MPRGQKKKKKKRKKKKEWRYKRDDQRREAVPLVEGEGRLVVKKLAAGAYGVRKIIEFRKPKGRGPAQVETRWETVAAPPCGPELRRILEATAEADWPQDVRVALGEKVAEIRQLGEGQGAQGLVRAGRPPTLSWEWPPLSGSPTRRCATARRGMPCKRKPGRPNSK